MATSSGIRVWRPGGPAGLEARRGVGVTHAHPDHWHDEFQMVLIDGGAGALAYRHNALPTVAGSFFVVPPGEVHANYATVEAGCSFRTVNLRPEPYEGLEALGPLLRMIPVTVTAEREVVESFSALHRAVSVPESRLASETALLEFLEVLCRRCVTPAVSLDRAGREPAAVRTAQEYLNEHIGRNVSLAELAEVTRLSRYHLVRVFKKAVGLPPHAYQNGMRVQRSCRLLQQGWKPAAVASSLGFADQAHFTRHFKRVVGLPPQLYQRQSNNVQDPSTVSV